MITIEHLHKRRGPRHVLHDVSFTAEPGRVTGLLGPNGAGKSSTLRIALGLDRADSGTAYIQGQPYADLPHPLRAVGAVLDGCGAHRSRTARNHLKWVAAAGNLPRQRIDEVLQLVGLTDAASRRVSTFSLGMGQRLGLATALLGEPEVLVLDEPMNGLDPSGMLWMREMMRQHARDGGTVLVSSHALADINDVADDVVIMAEGKVAAAGTIEDVASGFGSVEAAFFAHTQGTGVAPW